MWVGSGFFVCKMFFSPFQTVCSLWETLCYGIRLIDIEMCWGRMWSLNNVQHNGQKIPKLFNVSDANCTIDIHHTIHLQTHTSTETHDVYTFIHIENVFRSLGLVLVVFRFQLNVPRIVLHLPDISWFFGKLHSKRVWYINEFGIHDTSNMYYKIL